MKNLRKTLVVAALFIIFILAGCINQPQRPFYKANREAVQIYLELNQLVMAHKALGKLARLQSNAPVTFV